MVLASFISLWYFYPRPLRGGRPLVLSVSAAFTYFYPRPLRGGRLIRRHGPVSGQQFLSTPSARRATVRETASRSGLENFYPRPLRGGRHLRVGCRSRAELISIHALCEEGDHLQPPLLTGQPDFYPRPLRGGRRKLYYINPSIGQFLSTPSARRATIIRLFRVGNPLKYFYPRPLRGGRQQKQRQNLYFQTNYTTFCTNLEEL